MKTAQKTGPAGPSVKETDAGGSFKKASIKAPVPSDPGKALEYGVKPSGGMQQAGNPARQRQKKVLRFLR